MTFRNDGKKTHEWNLWVMRNKPKLTQAGLPDLIFSDESHWLDFLDHGFLDHHNDPLKFHIDILSLEQKRVLFDILESELSEQEKQATHVYRLLQGIFRQAQPSAAANRGGRGS